MAKPGWLPSALQPRQWAHFGRTLFGQQQWHQRHGARTHAHEHSNGPTASAAAFHNQHPNFPTWVPDLAGVHRHLQAVLPRIIQRRPPGAPLEMVQQKWLVSRHHSGQCSGCWQWLLDCPMLRIPQKHRASSLIAPMQVSFHLLSPAPRWGLRSNPGPPPFHPSANLKRAGNFTHVGYVAYLPQAGVAAQIQARHPSVFQPR